MISTKYTAIIAVLAFASGSFIASPELRAYAAAMITSADIVNETIQSEDIKNGEVKASDIATGAVGSTDIFDGGVQSRDIAEDAVTDRELAGDWQCIVRKQNFITPSGGTFEYNCGSPFTGGLDGTFILATLNDNASPITTNEPACFIVMSAEGFDDDVRVLFKNLCKTEQTFGGSQVSILVFQ